MVQVYYASSNIISEGNRDTITEGLPDKARTKLAGLKREEDKLLMLTSLHLLAKALHENGHSDYRLCDLQYTSARRPFFANAPFDFNISHTDCCAAVVFSENSQVGIDIEKIKGIDLSDFEIMFSREVWWIINTSANKLQTFYYYWTLVESAVKADGRGLPLISSAETKILKDQVLLDGKYWYFYHQNFDPSIFCCVASDKKAEPIQLIEINQ